MSPPRTRWIVRESGFPFALPGKVLGIVEAPDATVARMRAVQRFDVATVVEPEHRVNPELERVVERAVKAASRRDRRGYARGGFRGQAMSDRRLTNPDPDEAA